MTESEREKAREQAILSVVVRLSFQMILTCTLYVYKDNTHLQASRIEFVNWNHSYAIKTKQHKRNKTNNTQL